MAIAQIEQIKIRLKGLLEDDNLVREYLRRYGPNYDIKYIKKVKEAGILGKANLWDGDSPIDRQGTDPIFDVQLKCTICGNPNVIFYELKAKSQSMTFNRFLVPLYKGAFGNMTVDYNKLSVAVCNRCLFASPDKKDFISIDSVTNQERPVSLPPNVIMALQEKIGERKILVRAFSNTESLFKRPRDFKIAVLTYQLAIFRAKVESEHEIPNALYKLGSYSLRIANFLKYLSLPNDEYLRSALNYYKECFSKSNVKSQEIEIQMLYVVIALCLKLKDEKQASMYIGAIDHVMMELNNRSKTEPINTTIPAKWHEKAKDLWMNRADESLFINE